jgi:chemotaxis protein CheD
MQHITPWPDHATMQVRHVIQGSHLVSGDPRDVLTTILGSCVATCMWDPVAAVGGMNHFLLAQTPDAEGDGFRYGLHAMELLINTLLKHGARRDRLLAKLFGGAAMQSTFSRIGQSNGEFAKQFLTDEGIRLVAHSLGGSQARRIRFVPTTGQAQQRFVTDTVPDAAPEPPPAAHDDITFFDGDTA